MGFRVQNVKVKGIPAGTRRFLAFVLVHYKRALRGMYGVYTLSYILSQKRDPSKIFDLWRES